MEKQHETFSADYHGQHVDIFKTVGKSFVPLIYAALTFTACNMIDDPHTNNIQADVSIIEGRIAFKTVLHFINF